MAKYSPITIARFWSKVDVKASNSECWPWLAGTRSGYGFMKINGKCVTSSRIAWELANEGSLGDQMALHQCDNRICCNPHHIHAGNHAENMAEAKERGRMKPRQMDGTLNPRAKLSKEDVERIRELIRDGHTNVAIASRLPVTHSMVSRIRRGKSWKTNQARTKNERSEWETTLENRNAQNGK